ncbi:hypothetical protein HK098_000608, partial [Nowakowskiella sp. JEL0407]
MVCKWCKSNLTEKTLLRMLRNYFDESGESFNDYPEFFMDDVEIESDDRNLEKASDCSPSEDIRVDRNLHNADNVRNLDNASNDGNLVYVKHGRSLLEVEENDDNDVIDVDGFDIVEDNAENVNYDDNVIDVDAIDIIEDNAENINYDNYVIDVDAIDDVEDNEQHVDFTDEELISEDLESDSDDEL